jgi:hypothetical protein
MLVFSPFNLQDHIFQSHERGQSVTSTNRGATISKSLHVNPALKVLVAIFNLDMRNPPQIAERGGGIVRSS